MTSKTLPHLVRANLGVDWYLPGSKRRFATSTKATSDLVVALAESGGTLRQVR